MAGYIGGKVAVSSPQQIETKHTITATANQTSIPNIGYTVGAVHVYQNGVRLIDGTDFTATNGSTVTLETGATEGDQIVIVSHGSFETGDVVSKASGGTFAAAMNYPGGAVTGNVTFGDSNKIFMGASSDLSLYHDGSNSYLQDGGTGYLVISSDGPGVRINSDTAEVMADFTPNGAATLYHNNAAKLATTATGIDVTGAITVGGAALGSGGMEFIASSGVIDDAANAAFTQFDATKYDHYQFWFQNVIPVTDDVQLHGFTSSDGGSSYDAGSSDYRTHSVAEGTSVAFGFLLNGLGNIGSASGETGINSIFGVMSPHLATFTSVNADGGSVVNRDGKTHGSAYFASGFTRRSAADVDAIKFAFSSGNIESGEIVMYGIANGS